MTWTFCASFLSLACFAYTGRPGPLAVFGPGKIVISVLENLKRRGLAVLMESWFKENFLPSFDVKGHDHGTDPHRVHLILPIETIEIKMTSWF